MCGHSDVAYVDEERKKLCRGNQFTSAFYDRKTFIRETPLPKAKTVTFLENVRIYDW